MHANAEATALTARSLRRLRLRHVELLIALGSAPTMRAAAGLLNLSQPAVSKMVGEIESLYETALFLRSRRGVECTPAGRVLIAHALAIRQQLLSAAESVGALRRGHDGLLRIGTFSTTSVVPLAIASMRRDYPDAQVRIREAPPVPLLEQLLDGELDIVVCSLPPTLWSSVANHRLSLESVSADELCVVAAPSNPLARRRVLQWRDLSDARWALPPADALMRQALSAGWLQLGLRPPEPVVESLSAITMRWLVRFDTDLLGVMRQHQAREEHALGLLRILPVRPVIALPDISMIHCHDAADVTGLVTAFRAALRSAGRARIVPRAAAVQL